MKQARPKKRKLGRALLMALATLVVLAGADYWLYGFWGKAGDAPSGAYQNGLWLRYTWYFGEKSESDIRQLAEGARKHRIRDAYFHVRYIKADGTLRFRYPEQARKLNSHLGKLAPNVRRIAWMFAGHGKLGDVDLSRAEIRAQMAKEAAWLVNECGFQGIQWDYEICLDGDPHFLDLLERTRSAMPAGAFLQVAAPMWFPMKGIGWSTTYFGQVAKRCDQVAVMCYDSGFYFPRAYTWLVERQVRVLPEAVRKGNPRCELVLGLPTYEEGPPSHNSHAENLRFALWGVRKGLSATSSDAIDGIAIFADYTTDDREWETLERYWR